MVRYAVAQRSALLIQVQLHEQTVEAVRVTLDQLMAIHLCLQQGAGKPPEGAGVR